MSRLTGTDAFGLTEAYKSVYEIREIEEEVDVNILDTFDLVVEYLIREGYAENENNAIVIMANMSESWIYDIVEAYWPWDKPKPNAPSPRDQAALRQTQVDPARAAQIKAVRLNMRQGINKTAERTLTDPRREGTAPFTPRHIRSAQTMGGMAGGKMFQRLPNYQPSTLPSTRIPATPELRRRNTAAQLRQALRMSGSLPNTATPSGATGTYYPGAAPGYGIGQTKLAT